MLYSLDDQSVFPLRTHVVEKIEIITAIIVYTLFWYRINNWVAFKTYSFCIS